jgi:hypothetical protein
MRDMTSACAACTTLTRHADSCPRLTSSLGGLAAASSVGSLPSFRTIGSGAGFPRIHASYISSSIIEAWLKGYDAAFNAKDLDKLATFYHPGVTIYEGGAINNGWVDYRDRRWGQDGRAADHRHCPYHWHSHVCIWAISADCVRIMFSQSVRSSACAALSRQWRPSLIALS